MVRKVVFHIYNLSRGGAERVLVNLAERFAKEGIETLIVTQARGENEYSLSTHVRRLVMDELSGGVSIVPSGLVSRMSAMKQKIKALRHILLEEKPDVVIAFDRSACYRAPAAAKGICPVIVSVRNDPQKHYAGIIHKLYLKKYFYKATGCVFQTEEARGFFDRDFAKKSIIIINPLNSKYVKTEFVPPSGNEIVCVGRISSQKNPLLLLQAFVLVNEQMGNAAQNYIVRMYGDDVGDGTKQVLESFIAEHHLQNRVFLMGNCDDLESRLPGKRLFVLPSNYEGMPNALMEAMAMGLPCIATDCPCGGPATLISDGENGVLVPVGNAVALAEAMKNVLDNKTFAEKLAENAVKIRDRANEDTIFVLWKEYVESIVDREN